MISKTVKPSQEYSVPNLNIAAYFAVGEPEHMHRRAKAARTCAHVDFTHARVVGCNSLSGAIARKGGCARIGPRGREHGRGRVGCGASLRPCKGCHGMPWVHVHGRAEVPVQTLVEVKEQTGDERGSQATECLSGLEDEAKQRGSSPGTYGTVPCMAMCR
jgi:hypothetical protein